MMAYDPDVVRWNLHTLIDTTCCLPSQGSCSTVTWLESGLGSVGLVREGYVDTVENDAVIARALQEEYSRVAALEASGISDPGKERILAQDWPGHSEMRTRGDDSGSCSSVEEQPHGFEEPVLDIADGSALDGEVGKRLNQMVPVRHVPKINGSIPSEDEEISDHERLLERLKVYDLVENKIQGDGNCQFRALSDQLYRSPEYHKHVREQVVQQLKSDPEAYGGYVPMAYNIYLKKMSKSGEWGDHVTLQAAADTYGVKIFILTSFKDTCYVEILPHVQKSNRVIFLSFWAEVHYNSIYPEGELPVVKKKKWWSLTG